MSAWSNSHRQQAISKITRVATVNMIHCTRVRSCTHAKPECLKDAPSPGYDCSLHYVARLFFAHGVFACDL
jgi:hypothetical protein